MNCYCSWDLIRGICTCKTFRLTAKTTSYLHWACLHSWNCLTMDCWWCFWEFSQVLHHDTVYRNLIFIFPWIAFFRTSVGSSVAEGAVLLYFPSSLFDSKLILEICMWALRTAAVPSHAPIFKASIADAFFVSAAIGSWEDSGGMTVSHNISCLGHVEAEDSQLSCNP